MTDPAWINAALTAARPQAIAALLRYFRDLDTAEEAFQEACLRALKSWRRERAAAGRYGVADPGRPQRRPRQPAPAAPAGAAAGGGGALRSRRRGGGSRRAARRRALPRRRPAPPLHVLPPDAPGDAADRAGTAHRLRSLGEADRPRLPGERCRDGAAHHPRQGQDRRRQHSLRGAARRRARPAPRRRRRHDLPRLQRGLFRRHQPRASRALRARRSGSPDCCCASSRPSRRSWGWRR